MKRFLIGFYLFFLIVQTNGQASGFSKRCERFLEVFHPATYSSDLNVRYSGIVSIAYGDKIRRLAKDKIHSTLQSTHHLEEFGPIIRNVVEELKKRSVEGAPAGFREYGAQIAINKNDQVFVTMVTSNNPLTILPTHLVTYEQDSPFLTELHAGNIVSVINIHTHPGPEFRLVKELSTLGGMFISRSDFEYYAHMQAFLTAFSPTPVKFIGLVAPVFRKDPNLVFKAEEYPIDLQILKRYMDLRFFDEKKLVLDHFQKLIDAITHQNALK